MTTPTYKTYNTTPCPLTMCTLYRNMQISTIPTFLKCNLAHIATFTALYKLCKEEKGEDLIKLILTN